MKVKDLLGEINSCLGEYGDEFLEWDVFVEQLGELDREMKKENPQWRWLTDDEGWEYIECAGFWGKFIKEKAFTVNVNY